MKRACLALAASALLGGCAPYTLRGRVIEGAESAVLFVDASDPRLRSLGIDGAVYTLTLDPESLGRKIIARGETDGDGGFAIPIREFGAGVLEYDFELLVRHVEHNSAQEFFRLPGPGRRVLVILERGPDRYKPREDPLDGARDLLNE